MKKQSKASLRHAAIKELLAQEIVPNQVTLVQLLHERYGIQANQSLISKDLRTLEVQKQKAYNHLLYELKESDPSKEILRLAIRNVLHNESMLVIETLPGLAAFVGDYLDMQKNIHILATLAGENVVFIIPRTVKNIHTLFKEVSNLVYFKKPKEDRA